MQAQLAAAYPHLAFETVRGNLNTRLRKLEESVPGSGVAGAQFAALCLAAAGVIRLGWRARIGQCEPGAYIHYTAADIYIGSYPQKHQ